LHIRFCRGRQPASPLGHIPRTMRGQTSQAMPHTPIFIEENESDDIIHHSSARAGFAHKIGDFEMIGMLLIAVEGLNALEFRD